MRTRRTLPLALLALAGTLLLTACPNRTNIGKILDNPDRYRDKEVGVAGRVRDSYGAAFVGGAYKIDDGTGEIWVISRRGVPSKGAGVGVRGRVYNGFSFGGRNFGTVIEESERKSR